MGLETLLSRYQLAARAEGLSPGTVRHVKVCLKFFESFLGGIDDVGQIQADDLRRFIIACQERPKWPGMPQSRGNGTRLSGTSINTYVRGIKSFYSWLAREGIIADNPLAAVPAPRLPKRLPKIYSDDDLKAVFKTAARSPRDSALMQLFLDSGIRLSELAGLQPGDIDLATGAGRVFGKGGKERPIFISPPTALAIDNYLRFHRPQPAADNRLFLTIDGYPLTPGRIQKILERIGRRAGIGQRLSPHKFRHSFATLSLRNGSNLEILRRALGHSEIRTTEIYLHLVDEDLRDSARRTSPIKHLLGHNVRGRCIVGGREYEKGSPEYFEAMRGQRSS